jgi:hypothetical protein
MRRAIGAAVVSAFALLLFAPTSADAVQVTPYRCSSQFVDRPWPTSNTNVTLCWQYTYHAQADGTGIVATNLFVDCTHNCGDIEYITRMTVKAVNPKTGAVNDSQSIAEIDSQNFPSNRSLSLTGRDVGTETLRWDFDWQAESTYLNHEQFNDCLSLGTSYAGPCD